MDKKRIEFIDCAKGIAILLVIVGHTIGGITYGIIYSFHMPLFFIVSCATYKYSTNNDEFVKKTQKSFYHLIMPMLLMYCIDLIYNALNNIEIFKSYESIKYFFIQNILKLTYASGYQVTILSSTIDPINIPWFLVVLFCGRCLFDYLHLKLSNNKLVIYCLMLSVIGVLLGKIQWLPLSFDIVLAIMPILYIGLVFNKFNVENKPFIKFIVYGFIWAVTFFPTYMFYNGLFIFVTRSYPLYPLCYITAIAGTFMIIEFCVLLMKMKKIVFPIIYLGKNTIYMLIIHYIDNYFAISVWCNSDNKCIILSKRLFFDIMMFISLMLIVEKKRKLRGSK